jgi:hypothetical protein
VLLVNVQAAVLIEQPVSSTDTEPVGRSVQDYVTVWVNSGVPLRDLTAFIVDSGDDVITGGSLLHGIQLSAICDITGPDMRDILTLIESRGGMTMPKSIFSRLVYASIPPLAMGRRTLAADKNAGRIIVLWPDAVWVLKMPVVSPYERQFTSYMVPEPASVILFGLGGLFLTRYKRVGICG